MRRRFRILRLLKWSGTLGCILVSAAFFLSGWFWWRWTGNQAGFSVTLSRGRLAAWYDFDRPSLASAPQSASGSHVFDLSLGRWPAWESRARAPWWRRGSLNIPMWLLFLMCLIPTLPFWFLDRRRFPPGPLPPLWLRPHRQLEREVPGVRCDLGG